MPEYVLKILYRFNDIDDVEARETMHSILSECSTLDPPCEYTLRKDGTDKVVEKGNIPMEKGK